MVERGRLPFWALWLGNIKHSDLARTHGNGPASRSYFNFAEVQLGTADLSDKVFDAKSGSGAGLLIPTDDAA